MEVAPIDEGVQTVQTLRGYQALVSVIADGGREYRAARPPRISFVRVGCDHVFVGLHDPPTGLVAAPLTDAHTLVAFDITRRAQGLDYRDEHALKAILAGALRDRVDRVLLSALASPIVEVFVHVAPSSSKTGHSPTEERHHALEVRRDGTVGLWVYDVSSASWTQPLHSSCRVTAGAEVLTAAFIARSSRIVWCERALGTDPSDPLACRVRSCELRVAADGRLSHAAEVVDVLLGCPRASLFALGTAVAVVCDAVRAPDAATCDARHGDVIVTWDSLRDSVTAFGAFDDGRLPRASASSARIDGPLAREFANLLLAAVPWDCAPRTAGPLGMRAVCARTDAAALVYLSTDGDVFEFCVGEETKGEGAWTPRVTMLTRLDGCDAIPSSAPIDLFCAGSALGVLWSSSNPRRSQVNMFEAATGRHVCSVDVPSPTHVTDAPLSLWVDCGDEAAEHAATDAAASVGCWHSGGVWRVRYNPFAFSPASSAASGMSWVARAKGGAESTESLRLRSRLSLALSARIRALRDAGAHAESARATAALFDAASASAALLNARCGVAPEVSALWESGGVASPGVLVLLCAGRAGCGALLRSAIAEYLQKTAPSAVHGSALEERGLLERFLSTLDADASALHAEAELSNDDIDAREMDRRHLVERLRELVRDSVGGGDNSPTADGIPRAPYWWAGFVTRLCADWPHDALAVLLEYFGLTLSTEEDAEDDGTGTRHDSDARRVSVVRAVVDWAYDEAPTAPDPTEFSVPWLGRRWQGRALRGALKGGVEWRDELLECDVVPGPHGVRFPIFEYVCRLLHILRPVCLPRFVSLVVAAMHSDGADAANAHAASTMYTRALDLLCRPLLQPDADVLRDPLMRDRAVAEAVLLAHPSVGRVQDAVRLLVDRTCWSEATALAAHRGRTDDPLHFELFDTLLTASIATGELARNEALAHAVLTTLSPSGLYSPYALLDSLSAGLKMAPESADGGALHAWEPQLGMDFDPSMHALPFGPSSGVTVDLFAGVVADACANLVRSELRKEI